MLLTILLQITTSQTELGVAPLDVSGTVSADISILDLVWKGGIIMVPILLLSFLSIYVIVERFLVIKKAEIVHRNYTETIYATIKKGDIEAAKAAAKQNTGPVGIMIQKGLQRIGQPIKNIESALEAAAKVEILKLEKGLSILGIVAAIAPMIGFVGTIAGVIQIFYNISLADNISIGLIAGGLYVKMVTSAAGLIVGIISHAGYHILNLKIEAVVLKLESIALEFLEVISE